MHACSCMNAVLNRFISLENAVHRLLVNHSISALRISLGAIFLGFGLLKYFPGVSPAEMLSADTTDVLFLGLIPASVAIYIVATMECFIGVCFLIGSDRLMRAAVWVLAAQFVGILSPLVIEPGHLFSGPHHAPTLQGQYVLKDIILVAAGMVVAAGAFRGGKLVRAEPQVDPAAGPEPISSERKLQIVLSGAGGGSSIEDVCREHHISEATFYAWRDISIAAATEALQRSKTPTPTQDEAAV